MAAFVAAYLLVWLGLLWYVLRLGAQQRRLWQALQALLAGSEAGASEPEVPPEASEPEVPNRRYWSLK
jgi:CcmD family protein